MQYGVYYAYADVADLIVGDVYPYDQWKGGRRPEMIWDEPIHQDWAQGGGKPVLTILQHAGGMRGTVLPYVVPPHHRRFMAYLVYVHGTRGVMWYAYGHGGGKYQSKDHPEGWEPMKKLAKEFEAMSPVLLSPDATEPVAMQVVAPRNRQDSAGNPAIHYLMKTHQGKRYLIAVNGTKETVQAAFRITAAIESIREIPDGRTIELTGRGMFADTFADYGVHVYEIALHGGSRGDSAATDLQEDADAVSPQVKEMRTWTDASGRFRIEASLVRHVDIMVQLRASDGRVVWVRVDQLSSADRDYLGVEPGTGTDRPAETVRHEVMSFYKASKTAICSSPLQAPPTLRFGPLETASGVSRSTRPSTGCMSQMRA